MFFKKITNKKEFAQSQDDIEALENLKNKLQEVLDYKSELARIGVDDLNQEQLLWLTGFKKAELQMSQAEGDLKKQLIAEQIPVIHRMMKINKKNAEKMG